MKEESKFKECKRCFRRFLDVVGDNDYCPNCKNNPKIAIKLLNEKKDDN